MRKTRTVLRWQSIWHLDALDSPPALPSSWKRERGLPADQYLLASLLFWPMMARASLRAARIRPDQRCFRRRAGSHVGSMSAAERPDFPGQGRTRTWEADL